MLFFADLCDDFISSCPLWLSSIACSLSPVYLQAMSMLVWQCHVDLHVLLILCNKWPQRSKYYLWCVCAILCNECSKSQRHFFLDLNIQFFLRSLTDPGCIWDSVDLGPDQPHSSCAFPGTVLGCDWLVGQGMKPWPEQRYDKYDSNCLLGKVCGEVQLMSFLLWQHPCPNTCRLLVLNTSTPGASACIPMWGGLFLSWGRVSANYYTGIGNTWGFLTQVTC